MSRLEEILITMGFQRTGNWWTSDLKDAHSVIHESHLIQLEDYLDNTKMWVQGSSLVYHPPCSL